MAGFKTKYYEKIEELEAQDVDSSSNMGFDFSVLAAKGLGAKLASKALSSHLPYALLRTFKPVLKVGNMYIVTRHKDVTFVRENDDIFEAPYGPEMKVLTGGSNFLLGMSVKGGHDDQLGHVLHAFKADDIDKNIVPTAKKYAEHLIDYSGGEIDVIHDYLTRIATETCAHYYGLEPEDPDAFAQWLMSLSALLFADYTGGEATRKLARAGAKRIMGVLDSALRKAQNAKNQSSEYQSWIKNTVIGRLVARQTKLGKKKLPDQEIKAMLMGLSVGFVPTGAGAGGNILEVLLNQPAVMKKAKAAARADDDETLNEILIETMRFNPPIIPGLPRCVTKDTKIGGRKIPKGSTVLAAAMSGMLDGRVIKKSTRFKPGRDMTRDLNFGGAFLHYCIGETLFQKMILESFKPLLRQKSLRLAPGAAGKMKKVGTFPQHQTMVFDPVSGYVQKSQITIVVSKLRASAAAINVEINKLGNPASPEVRKVLDKNTLIHFTHMTAIEDPAKMTKTGEKKAHLIIEINADGPPGPAINSYLASIIDVFAPVFDVALGTSDFGAVKEILHKYYVDLRKSPFHLNKNRTSGLYFFGTPELPATRIVKDKEIASAAKQHLNKFYNDKTLADKSPGSAMGYVREKLKHSALGVELARPKFKTLAVSRRTTVSGKQTALRILFDKDMLRFYGFGIFVGWLIYFMFMKGNAAKITQAFSNSSIVTNGLAKLVSGGLLIVSSLVAAFFIIKLGAAVRQRLRKKSEVKTQEGPQKPNTLMFLITLVLTTIAAAALIPFPFSDDVFSTTEITGKIVQTGKFVADAFVYLLMGTGIFLALALIVFTILALLLRFSEMMNPPEDQYPSSEHMDTIAEKENSDGHAQNHIIAVTPMKGQTKWIRRLAMSFGFFFIEKTIIHRFIPGFVFNLGTIHFARWFRLPGSHTLMFFSNYDGSWESYLEDFVTKAAIGQNAAWSNGIGYPKTDNLFFGGASDAARFKRWVRRQQVVSQFWYSKYPDLTTDQVRNNSLISEGLAKAKTVTQMKTWLDLVGSRPRPPSALESQEIQALLFGGLGHLKSAVMMPIYFPAKETDFKKTVDWLGNIQSTPDGLTFDDKKPEIHAMNIAMSKSGLQRLGLGNLTYKKEGHDSNTLQSFPSAFTSGMSSAARASLLGDNHEGNWPDDWQWGRPSKLPDAVLLIYAADEKALNTYLRSQKKALKQAEITWDDKEIVNTSKLPEKSGAIREPFGFRDGVSQPVLRGSRQFHSGANDIHVVEPGEFILGYKDDHDFYPDTPLVPSDSAGATGLPSLPSAQPNLFPDFSKGDGAALKDFGRNGSFLVIRQLEQDVKGFNNYLTKTAKDLKDNLGHSFIDKEWLGAKLMGRWKDGSSLVRHPNFPQSKEKSGEKTVTKNGKTIKEPIAIKADNDFMFGVDDPQGLRCPYGSHVRRTNPRDSFEPGSEDQLKISNRHRILRRGRVYEQAAKKGSPARKGLLFMCFNADLERQFEFIQQTWVVSSSFHGLDQERDSISSSKPGAQFTIPTDSGPIVLKDMQSFVSMKGGGYYFMPGRSALKFLYDLNR